jgi:cytochrome c oxidase subunit 4
MSGFNDPYPSYEHLAHHSEEEGKIKRKKLWRVFWIMLGITLFELYVGFNAEGWHMSKLVLKVLFIALTIAKAAYIVLAFMHLGEEKTWYKWVVLGPFIVFAVYLVLMVDIGEGSYSKEYRFKMDQNVLDQQEKQHKEHGAAAEGEAKEASGEEAKEAAPAKE